jgi:hypothetical protein
MFRREYNEVRPHSSLGQLTPIQFKQTLSTMSPQQPHLRSNHWSDESRQVRGLFRSPKQLALSPPDAPFKPNNAQPRKHRLFIIALVDEPD